jgi:hypothetical protein
MLVAPEELERTFALSRECRDVDERGRRSRQSRTLVGVEVVIRFRERVETGEIDHTLILDVRVRSCRMAR